uniref:Uncharacterized protein n=1 Tax=Romanomermis culicivorax TaxID=13658 RepID=A0A915KQJ9_ROMCU
MLFLYEARGLDNPSCLLQAYNTAVGVNPPSLLHMQTYTLSSRRRNTTDYGHYPRHSCSVCFDGHDDPRDPHGCHNDCHHHDNRDRRDDYNQSRSTSDTRHHCRH